MKDTYLEVTFRHGRPFAAYLYLPREPGEKAERSSQADPGMVVDFGPTGRPIGIELTAPTLVTLEALNRVLEDLGLPPLAPPTWPLSRRRNEYRDPSPGLRTWSRRAGPEHLSLQVALDRQELGGPAHRAPHCDR